MSRFQSQDFQLNQKDDFLINPPPTQPNYENPSSSSSAGRISPVLLLIIVILAVIFFISGLVHLLFRFFVKKKLPSTSILFHSNRYTDTSGGSHAIQRQLQQLFRLHDSGLDQTSIDSLPVFLYKDIMGLNEPLDCAVCLYEFSCHDKLRLLPICSHAFHIKCIDTWLLSNSTCPLCRGTLLSSGLPMQIPVFNFDDSIELSSGCVGDGENGVSWGEKRVFSVRLGKFRSLNDEGGGYGEASRCNLDARRCYSMGSFQYVVGDSYLQVTLSPDSGGGGGVNFAKVRGQNGNSKVDGDVEGKKISSMTRGESFSVSKIWLWSKKSKLPSYSDSYNMGVFPVSLDKDLPFTYI